MGHLRDVRRLVVAMSRAKLGLYIFGRKDLFANCYELQPVFSKLLQRPTVLSLRPNETYMQTTRAVSRKNYVYFNKRDTKTIFRWMTILKLRQWMMWKNWASWYTS